MTRIRTNTAALTVSFFATALLYFLQLKILTNFLEQEVFGAWTAVTSTALLLIPFAELGMAQVLVRYGAKYEAEGRTGRLVGLFVLALKVLAGGALVVVGVLLLTGPALADLLSDSETEVQIDRWLLLLGFTAVLTGSLRALNNATLRGLRRMPAMAALEIGFGVLLTIGYFLFREHLNVGVVFVLWGTASLGVAVAGIAYLLRRFRELPPDPSPGGIFREVQGFWHGAATGGVFLIAIEQLDKPILAAGLIGLDQLALFQVASRLALFPRRLAYVPLQVLYPEITHKWEGPRRAELRHDMELFTKLMLGLGLGMVAVLAVFAEPLLVLVANRDYASGAPILWMFLAVLPLISLHQPMVVFLRATGLVWYAFVAEAAWLSCYLGVGALLIPRFGLPGFVGGQLVGSALVLVYLFVVFHRLKLPRPSVPFYLKRIVISAAVWFPAVAVGSRFTPRTLAEMVLAVVSLLVLGNLMVVLGRFLTREEEERTLAMLAGRGRLGRLVGVFFAWPRRVFGVGGDR